MAEAVRLDARADHFIYGDGADTAVGHAFATRALTHATLALAGFARASVDHVHDVCFPDEGFRVTSEGARHE